MTLVAFVGNVGNRDVTLNIGDDTNPFFVSFDKGEEGLAAKKFLGCRDEGARALASCVRERLNALERQLRFPILSPALTKALELRGKIDRLLLFASDQPEGAGQHYLWDTIESARLLEVCLPRQFPGKIADIRVEPAVINPSLHDQAFTFVGETLRRLIPPLDADHVFASVKGGIPAMNAALREHGVAMYGPKVCLIEVEEPGREDRLAGRVGPARIASTWPFRCGTILRLAGTLLRRFDYEGLRIVLDSEGVRDAEVVSLLMHAHSRLNLDFEDAAQSLQRFGRGRALQWRISAQAAWSRQRLLDVARSAAVSLTRQDFIGFLARVATFCENCRRQLVFTLTGLRIEGLLLPSSVHDPKLLAALRARKKLSVLKASGRGEPPWRADRDLFNVIVHHWVGSDKGDRDVARKVQEVQGHLKQLEGLEKLRHEALHLMKGISGPDIAERLPEPGQSFSKITASILANLESMERMLGAAGHTVDALYEDINADVLERLGKYQPRDEKHEGLTAAKG